MPCLSDQDRTIIVGRTRWKQVYRARMRAGLEYCRKCHKKTTELCFGHLIPRSKGGKFTFKNITITCVSCEHMVADTILSLPSLYDEELKTGIFYSRGYRLIKPELEDVSNYVKRGDIWIPREGFTNE